MKRTVLFAALAALVSSYDAIAACGIARVSIIDRSSGTQLVPRLHRGEYWVAGTPGATYAIEIHNCIGERILAVTSVDGVNVISGGTAGWDQTGYVFAPGQRYEITGWRKSDAEVAAFTFTASPNSYAERTGRPANVGVIGVAIFRERQPQPVYEPPAILQSPAEPAPAAENEDRRELNSAARDDLPAAAPAPDAPPSAAMGSAAADAATRTARRAPPPPASAAQGILSPSPSQPLLATAPKLGTGHGNREPSYVNHTEFTRMQPQPNEVIHIRYDSFDNLVAMGIVKRPRAAVSAANPFPASPEQQYVPDPPGLLR